MGTWNLRSAVFIIFFSFIVCWQSLKFHFGRVHNPGPGFFPLILGALLGMLGILLLIKAFFEKGGGEAKTLWVGSGWRKVAFSAAGLLLYSFVLDRIGFPVATTLLLMFFFRFIAPQRWYVLYGASPCIAVLSYVIFRTWLGIQLPLWGVFD